MTEVDQNHDEPAELVQWAIIEIFGHRRHIGRLSEIEQFGAKMARIDQPKADGGFETLIYAGSALFSITPCTEEYARKAAERHWWSAPTLLEFEDPDFREVE